MHWFQIWFWHHSLQLGKRNFSVPSSDLVGFWRVRKILATVDAKIWWVDRSIPSEVNKMAVSTTSQLWLGISLCHDVMLLSPIWWII